MFNARIKVKETQIVTPQETLSFSLNKVIAGRAIRLLAAVAGTVGLLYLVVLLPGMIMLALPGGIATAGKVYDEVRLIRYLKYGEPMNPGSWEEAEVSTEMTRIKVLDDRDVYKQFSR